MLKFAVCDDEPFAVQEISAKLAGYLAEKQLTSYCIHSFFNGQSLLDSSCSYDLIFLDIKMQRPDGLETAKMLRRRLPHKNSLLVFVTNLKEYVFESFEVQAYDYLVKPLDGQRFRRTMDRAVGALTRQQDNKLVIQRGNACQILPLAKIVYCEVQGRKIFIHQIDGKITDYYEKLDILAQRVDGRFFRCHRSYLVNLDYVRGCRAGQVVLAQGHEIPVSRLREQDFRQALLRHMKEGGG